MSSLPRIVTVDPAGTIAQMVRATTRLLDSSITLIEAPDGNQAIEEVKYGNCDVVISTWETGSDMKGWELAALIRQTSQEIPIIILAHEDDLEMDEETIANSPFHFMQRPVDAVQFLRAMKAVVNKADIAEALQASSAQSVAAVDMGPVPMLDVNAAQGIINGLLTDLGAMAIVLATREGQMLLEAGAAGMLDREKLTQSLLPSVTGNISVKDIVGGQSSNLQFYDGEDFDVFVLSIGLHHFMCIIFEGSVGGRSLGAVNSWGWRAANDLLAMLGPAAWQFQQPRPKPQAKVEPKAEEQDEPVQLERSGFDQDDVEEVVEEPPSLELEPIPDDQFDADSLFDDGDSDVDDDIFDLDNIEGLLAQDAEQGDQIDFETARRLGLI